jgi:hypothetical protein
MTPQLVRASGLLARSARPDNSAHSLFGDRIASRGTYAAFVRHAPWHGGRLAALQLAAGIGLAVGLVFAGLALMRGLDLLAWSHDYSAGGEEQWPANVSVAAWSTGMAAAVAAYTTVANRQRTRFVAPLAFVLVAAASALTGWLATRGQAQFNPYPYESGHLATGQLVLASVGAVFGATAGRYRLGPALPAPLLLVVALALVGRRPFGATTFGAPNGNAFQPTTVSLWLIRGGIVVSALMVVLWLTSRDRNMLAVSVTVAGLWALPASAFWWRPGCGSIWSHAGCPADHNDWITPFGLTADWAEFAAAAAAAGLLLAIGWRVARSVRPHGDRAVPA